MQYPFQENKILCRFFYVLFLTDSPAITNISVPAVPVVEFDYVTLSCVVDANPEPDEFVTWERDSIKVEGSTYLNGTSTLTLNTHRGLAGYYQCIADNGIGGVAESEELPLTIHCKLLYLYLCCSKSNLAEH